MVIIQLPRNLDSQTMYGLIGKLIGPDNLPVCENATLDFARLGFVEPVGITVLSNLIEWLGTKGVGFKFVNHRTASGATKYLDDSLFFRQYLGTKIFPTSRVRSTTLPLQRVKHMDSYSWIENTFTPWLSSRLNLTPQSFENIKVCLEELFNNIDDHADQDTGCIFVQHYPNKNEIVIGLSDFGLGIPYNVSKVSAEKDDGQAILLATTEGFTTLSTPRNRGAGLDILLNVVARNGGGVSIYSNHGILSCRTFNGLLKKIPRQTEGFYPGTLFDITFRTDTLESSDAAEEEKFEW